MQIDLFWCCTQDLKFPWVGRSWPPSRSPNWRPSEIQFCHFGSCKVMKMWWKLQMIILWTRKTTLTLCNILRWEKVWTTLIQNQHICLKRRPPRKIHIISLSIWNRLTALWRKKVIPFYCPHSKIIDKLIITKEEKGSRLSSSFEVLSRNSTTRTLSFFHQQMDVTSWFKVHKCGLSHKHKPISVIRVDFANKKWAEW